MNLASIRVRLAAWYLSVLVSGLILLGTVAWAAMRYELHRSLDKSLSAEVAALTQYLERESEGNDLASVVAEAREYTSGLPKGQRLRVFEGADGAVLLSFPNDKAPEGMFQKTESALVRGHALRLELSGPIQPIEEILELLKSILFWCIPGIFVFAAAGGWWLSRTALQPVDRMTSAAESISLNDLSARLAVPETGDELQHLGEAWNKMLDRLSSSVEKMKRFTADAAHELRTPITIIRSTAELALRRDRDTASYRQALSGIADEARSLSELVADLLWLARNDAAQVTYNFESFRCADLIEDVCHSCEPLASGSRIALHARIENGGRDYIRADRSALRRVIVILIDNAIKFSGPDGNVEIRIAGDGQNCAIEVHDNGIGIAHEELPLIFDRFYSSDRARNGPGAGLGLSIARAVVEAHDGRIEVASTPVVGSCFRVVLPIDAVAHDLHSSDDCQRPSRSAITDLGIHKGVARLSR